MYFFEDMFVTLHQLSLFNSKPEIIYKIISKLLINIGNSLSNECWQNLCKVNRFNLFSLSNMKLKIQESEITNMLNYIYNFNSFYMDSLINFFDFTTKLDVDTRMIKDIREIKAEIEKTELKEDKDKDKYQMKDFEQENTPKNIVKKEIVEIINKDYKSLCYLFQKILEMDLENNIQNIKLINESKLYTDNLKLIDKMKYLIIEKSEDDIKYFYDEVIISTFSSLIKIYERYEMIQDVNSDFIEIIQFELTYLIPKFLHLCGPENLQKIYLNLIDIIDTKNSNLRFSIKYLLKQYTIKNLITFKS